MGLEFTVDLTEETDLDDLERGGNVADGWYLCRLEDVYVDEKNQSMTKFKFIVIEEGAFKGRAIFDQISDPETARDSNGADMARRRIKLLAKRLGIVSETDLGTQASKSWTEAIGGDYLVHVATREFDRKDPNTGKPTGERGKVTAPDFSGIYPLDIPKDKFSKKDLPDVMAKYGAMLTGPDKAPKPNKEAASNQAAVIAAGQTASAPAPTITAPVKKPGRVTTDML